jgi:hypothetical protein
MPETHIGVIGSLPVLTPVERSRLAYALASIALRESGGLVLHHGCSEGADEIAHRIVRLLGGWQIHGHPAQADDGSAPHRRRARSAVADVDVGHQVKPLTERDADIVNASTILIVAGACREDLMHADKPSIGAADHTAGTAAREIFYLHPPDIQRKQSSQTGGAKRPAAPTAGVKDAAWATRQGRQDRKAGTSCGSYKGFRKRYNLVISEKTNEMWVRYWRSSRPTPSSTQRKRPVPRKRPDPSGAPAISEERLQRLQDLQRELNPPEAIRDAWR